jgi:hypothetical protein
VNPSDKLLGHHFMERRYLGCIEGGYESPFARHGLSLVSRVRSCPGCRRKNPDNKERMNALTEIGQMQSGMI